MLSYRRETALQSGLVMAKSGRLELGDMQSDKNDVCQLSRGNVSVSLCLPDKVCRSLGQRVRCC